MLGSLRSNTAISLPFENKLTGLETSFKVFFRLFILCFWSFRKSLVAKNIFVKA